MVNHSDKKQKPQGNGLKKKTIIKSVLWGIGAIFILTALINESMIAGIGAVLLVVGIWLTFRYLVKKNKTKAVYHRLIGGIVVLVTGFITFGAGVSANEKNTPLETEPTPSPSLTITPSPAETENPVDVDAEETSLNDELAQDLSSPELPEITGEEDAILDGSSGVTALSTIASLEVKGRAPKTGYSREEFGSPWADVDKNGCDTRNDILKRDLTNISFKDGTSSCVVLSGSLADPFSGSNIEFVRGQKTSSAVQIDHTVALSDAWQKGAQQWDASKRIQFANDPLNLMAVDGPLNAQKGDGDTATWLPPNKGFRCAYVARQVGVKYTYGLWVTSAERDAMIAVLSTCPNEPLPDGASKPEAKVATTPTPAVNSPAPVFTTQAPEPKPEPAVTTPPANDTGLDPQFSSCKKANEAGYGNYVRGTDPEYDWYRDRDGDGVVCEK